MMRAPQIKEFKKESIPGGRKKGWSEATYLRKKVKFVQELVTTTLDGFHAHLGHLLTVKNAYLEFVDGDCRPASWRAAPPCSEG